MSWVLFAYLIVGVAILTSVYWRFIVLEADFKVLKERIEYVNERINTKSDRMNEGHDTDIKHLDERLKILEKPGSDDP